MGLMRCNATATAALARAIGALPLTTRRFDWSRLSIPMTLELARMVLTTAELRDLTPGDILLLASDAPIAKGEVILRQGARALATGRLHQNTLTIERRLEATMQADDNGDALDPAPYPTKDSGGDPSADSPARQFVDAPTTPADPAGNLPENLEVRLNFDLGELSLPIADLEHLQPGYVLTLDTPAGRPVRIRAGQQVIGRGELVQIDDRLGVVVRELRINHERRSA